MPHLTNLHSIIQNGVTLAAAARGFGVRKSTASRILARLNDMSDVRNQPLSPPPVVDIKQWKNRPDYREW